MRILPDKFGKICTLLSLSLLLTACDMVDYHPYEVRIKGEKEINVRNIRRIEEACRDKDTLRFVIMGDSQRWYDETEDFVDDINRKGNVDFVIHGGDLTDFGVTSEFVWQRDILNKLDVPYVVLIGNHDYIGTGEEAFQVIFGKPNFSFIAGRVKFVCLDTNALENDYTTPIPDFTFIEEEQTARAEEFDRTVFSMHVCPYAGEFNNNVARVFQHYIKQYPGLLFCTAAHNHRVYQEEIFGDGVMYYMSDCMKHRNYYLFTITPDGYDYEVVYF